jgi:hypothetical protein
MPTIHVEAMQSRNSADHVNAYRRVIDYFTPGLRFTQGLTTFTNLYGFLHPLYAFLRLFTPLYKSPFCKTTTQISDYIDLVLALSRSRSGY